MIADDRGYEAIFQQFESPLMSRVRAEAYGEDIGQHSWVNAADLRRDIERLRLVPASRLLDLGCGPCGPLTYVVRVTGSSGVGVDVSAAAVEAGRARTTRLGLNDSVSVQQGDLNASLPFAAASFDAVISFDMVLHLDDRSHLFREVKRVLTPGGRFLFTDAGIRTGTLSDDELAQRSTHGRTKLVAPGFNERMLESAGLSLLEVEDRTASVLANAEGRLAARVAHRRELEEVEGAATWERERGYLETVIAVSRRGALSRMMYLAESKGTT